MVHGGNMLDVPERVIPALNTEDGTYLVALSSVVGLGSIRGKNPDAFSKAVLDAMPEGTAVRIEYEQGSVMVGPKPAA